MKRKRSDPRWRKIYAALNREAKIPGAKEMALGLALLGPGAPLGQGAPVQSEQPQHPVGWEHYEDVARAAASKHGIPPDMFLRLLHVENPAGDPAAVNPKSGATGMGQFMPETATAMSIDPRDPHSSIEASAKYLAELNREFDNWEHSVMAYNWGPGNVRRWLSGESTTPVPTETQSYVAAIEP